MSNVLKMLSRGGAAAAETDPNFKQTVLLLHGDGTNGAQNNTFLDSSSNNFTITRNPATGPNAPTQGTFSPFSVGAGEWSNYFDGNSANNLSIPTGAFSYTSGTAFTCEFWVYRTATPSTTHSQILVGSSGNTLSVYIKNDGSMVYGQANVADIITSASGVIQLNKWHHVAIGKSAGNTARIWVDGSSVGTATDTTNYATGAMFVGRNAAGNQNFAGYLSNIRSVTGTDVYGTGNTTITVPTAPLTSVTNTQVLTCQGNRFFDANTATTAKTITVNGSPRVTPFSPFAPSAAYSAGTNGGSGYFDGTGDYLSRAFTSTTDGMYLQGSTYTIEAWVYPNALTGTQYIYICNASNVAQYGYNTLYLSGTSVAFATRVATSGTEYARSGGTLTVGQWSHIAVSVNSNVAKLFLNGVQIGADLTIAANTFTPTGAGIGLNQNGAAGGTAFNGYISNLRLVQGQALTTGNFTPPTAPVTTSAVGWTGTNAATSLTGTTSLLLNFTNAGIIDNTGKNNLETVGNAQIDTAVKKYGTGSLEFDGTGDYLVMVSTPDMYLSTGDWTIEFWVYSTNIALGQGIIGRRSAATARGFIIGFTSSKTILLAGDTNNSAWEVNSAGSTTLSSNTWYHYAVVRNGNTFTVYINGTQESTATSSVIIADDTSPLIIGANPEGIDALNGFIDDLRITKGVARYPTEPFPTKAFPDL